MNDDDDVPKDASLPVQTKQIKKGFFDSKPKTASKPTSSTPISRSTTSSSSSSKTQPDPADDVEEIDIPMIRAKKAGIGMGGIPDMFRIEPSEQEKQYAKMKEAMVEKLKPTPDMVNQISGNASLLSGFDDPEVMAAVNDVAQNPQNFKKYKDNPKVIKFYSEMGKMMGEKLEKDEASQAQGQKPVPQKPVPQNQNKSPTVIFPSRAQ